MREICLQIGDGLHGTPLYSDNGQYPFINGNNLSEGKIIITASTKFVDITEFQRLFVNLSSNSILLSINGTLGKLAFYQGEKVVLGKSACYCDFVPEMNKTFMFCLMNTAAFQHFLEDSSTKSTIKNVGLKAIRDFKVIIPPLDLQNEFAAFIEQLDKSKVTIRKSIEKLETTYRALLQEYFG